MSELRRERARARDGFSTFAEDTVFGTWTEVCASRRVLLLADGGCEACGY